MLEFPCLLCVEFMLFVSLTVLFGTETSEVMQCRCNLLPLAIKPCCLYLEAELACQISL